MVTRRSGSGTVQDADDDGQGADPRPQDRTDRACPRERLIQHEQRRPIAPEPVEQKVHRASPGSREGTPPACSAPILRHTVTPGMLGATGPLVPYGQSRVGRSAPVRSRRQKAATPAAAASSPSPTRAVMGSRPNRSTGARDRWWNAGRSGTAAGRPSVPVLLDLGLQRREHKGRAAPAEAAGR